MIACSVDKIRRIVFIKTDDFLAEKLKELELLGIFELDIKLHDFYDTVVYWFSSAEYDLHSILRKNGGFRIFKFKYHDFILVPNFSKVSGENVGRTTLWTKVPIFNFEFFYARVSLPCHYYTWCAHISCFKAPQKLGGTWHNRLFYW